MKLLLSIIIIQLCQLIEVILQHFYLSKNGNVMEIEIVTTVFVIF